METNEIEKSTSPAIVAPEAPKAGNAQLIAGSIIIAGLLIAGAIIYTGGGTQAETGNKEQEAKVQPVTDKDHYLGNLDASIKIVEYSDTECPFCKRFHETMHKLASEYGPSGKLVWVYRHFPIASLHPKAAKEAEATECANELGGNDAFWKYIDRVFEVTPSNNGLDLAELPKIAEYAGLNVSAFNECLSSGRYAKKIKDSTAEGIVAGVNGTPSSFLITKDGDIVPISGARPYEDVKALIEASL